MEAAQQLGLGVWGCLGVQASLTAEGYRSPENLSLCPEVVLADDKWRRDTPLRLSQKVCISTEPPQWRPGVLSGTGSGFVMSYIARIIGE